MRLIRRLLSALKVKILIRAYKKKRVYIESGVIFNRNSKFKENIKIYANTQVLNSEIDNGTYISNNSVLNNCRIGAFCSIASSVNIIYGTHPTNKFISTHPSFFSVNKQAGFSFVNENLFNERVYADKEKRLSVVIGNDVWIGFGASIIEGVTIGDGAIIAAKALVTKDVPPYSIVVGIPAKVIRYRFSSSEIEKLVSFKWWNRDFVWIKENCRLFSDIGNLEKLIDNGNQ